MDSERPAVKHPGSRMELHEPNRKERRREAAFRRKVDKIIQQRLKERKIHGIREDESGS